MSEEEFRKGREIALRALARRSRTVSQMRHYLAGRGVGPETVERVIADLLERGHLDDRTYATFFAQDAARLRRQGRRRIDLELDKRGIAPELRKEVLDLLFTECSEVEIATQALEKRFAGKDLHEGTTREKAIRFLQRKGFGWDVIREALEAFTPQST
ncbi:MAG: hypothetical protein D6812_01475 [Deltaproteobacteria bacterium]|nr:MAG: hypothetical protein D6812_01475 [Deltaproteobacteria bacterium]